MAVHFVIFGKGRVRHIRGGRRNSTACNMFYTDDFRVARGDDLKLPVCGGCKRSLHGKQVLRRNEVVA